MKKLLPFILIHLSLFSYEKIKDTSNLKSLTYKDQKRCKIQLSNGLKVYIISDKNIERSSAALAVNAGSWEDPKKYPGMAHFLEHMLFQGTKKYPQREDFFRFIQEHSGQTNAATYPNYTVYSFAIENSYFIDGLDRFSQFFIAPLFDQDALQKELHAVDEEHKSHLNNERSREFYILKEISNPLHPFYNFSTGNKETLSVIPKTKFLQWHKNHYTANNMTLCILTNLPEKTILSVIEEKFEKIPNQDFKSKRPYQKMFSQKEKVLHIKPIDKTKEISLLFEIPPSFFEDKTKPLDFIAYHISSKHKNSLFDVLKKDNLITDISAHPIFFGKKNILFEISLNITEEGFLQKNVIIEKCFSYLNFLKKTKFSKELFDQIKSKKKNDYLYQTIDDPFFYTFSFAAKMLYEDFSTFPKNTYLPTKFSQKNLNLALTFLHPKNCICQIIADPKTDKTYKKERFLKGEYFVEDFSLKKIPTLSFSPPPINPFFSKNSKIKSQRKEKYIQIENNKHAKIFFIPNSLNIPKIYWLFHLHLPKNLHDIRSQVKTEIYLEALNKSLFPLKQMAKNAGFHISLFPSFHKIFLKISGNSDKSDILFEKFFKKIKNFSYTKEEFLIAKAEIHKKYFQKKTSLPIYQAYDFLSSLLLKNNPFFLEKEKILQTISFDDMKDFHPFSTSYIEATFCGNMDIQDCKNLFKTFQKNLPSSPFSLKEEKILALKHGPYEIIKTTPILGSGILLLIEEDSSLKNLASLKILSSILKEPFFTSLRSQQKTAYFVRAQDIDLYGHNYQMFSLQSSFLPVEEGLYRIEIFIDDFLKNFDTNIDQKRFEKTKTALIQTLKEKPKSLSELANKYHTLAFQKKDFDFLNKLIKNLEDLNFEDFKNFSNEFLLRKNKKRLGILFSGKIKENPSYVKIDEKSLQKKELYKK